VVVIASKLLIMMGLSHDCSKSLLFEAVEVDTVCPFGLSHLEELDAWSSEGNVSRQHGF
jgi:hypothetical protein